MRKPGTNTVALSDVARVAGVSTATVSLALRAGSRISAATRQRVLQAVADTGYTYNRAAARLRTGQSKIVGLMITDITNPYFASLALGAQSKFDELGYMMFLVNSNDDRGKQSVQLQGLLEHGVDGILFSPADGTERLTIAPLLEAGLVIVQVSRWLTGLACDVVGPDNVAMAKAAVEHLFERGHRRVAFIGGTPGRSAHIERLRGYRLAHEEAGLPLEPSLTCSADPTRENGARLFNEMYALADRPTAMLCYHDLMALGALQAAREQGVRVGEEFAIIGFDDIVEAALSNPPLATVHIDSEDIGRVAAERLIARLQGDESAPQHIIVPAHLVVRASCGS